MFKNHFPWIVCLWKSEAMLGWALNEREQHNSSNCSLRESKSRLISSLAISDLCCWLGEWGVHRVSEAGVMDPVWSLWFPDLSYDRLQVGILSHPIQVTGIYRKDSHLQVPFLPKSWDIGRCCLPYLTAVVGGTARILWHQHSWSRSLGSLCWKKYRFKRTLWLLSLAAPYLKYDGFFPKAWLPTVKICYKTEEHGFLLWSFDSFTCSLWE